MRKPRRVTVTLEAESRVPLQDMRKKSWWNDVLSEAKDEDGSLIEVVQAQANAIQEAKK